MNGFEFVNPTKVLFGKFTIGKIGKEITGFDVKKVLLLYGKSSIHKNGVYDKVVKSLKKSNIEFVELNGVKPNPTLTKVEEGIAICKNENIDGILAVGGGSVIDSAKAIGAGAKLSESIWDAFEGNVRPVESLPIFSILTISATASEMNPYAVITKEDENKKWPFSAGYESYPKVSIIDPTVQYTLPVYQTVNGAVDTISHILELYFDGSENTDVQDEYAEGIIRTVMKHVKVLIENPEDYNSRSQLAWCATLALNGTNGVGRSGGDWSTHGLEHSISAYFDVAHGAGLAVMFPAWLKYVSDVKPTKFVRFAENIFNITDGTDEQKIEAGINALKNFFQEISAPVTLKEIGVSEEDIPKLADNASMRGPIGKLKKLNRDEIIEIYKLAL